MKKLFFLAVAALALAACSKNELVESASSPSKAISFQVASYVNQTKANVAFASDQTFKTYAWYHDAANSSSQAFMSDETVSLHDEDPAAYWAPDRTYFWPKTGFINFFSYAGTTYTVSSNNYPVVTEGKVEYGNLTSGSEEYVTIGTSDDALLASAAYRYSSSDWNHDEYGFNYGTSYSNDVTGVPTLFHHLLSKVSFIVKFDATSVTGTAAEKAKHSWTLTINSVKLYYENEGAIAVNYSDPGSTGLAWPSFTNEIGWTPKLDGNTNISGTPGAAQTVTGGNASAGNTVFNEITVLPQDVRGYHATYAPQGTGVKLALDYTLSYSYDGGSAVVERVNLTDDAVSSYEALGAISVAAFTADYIPYWQMNHKYIYTVTIRPNNTITFSPAVVDWETAVNAGYVYPQL